MARVAQVQGVKETIAELKVLEPGMIAEMRKELKNGTKATISKIKTNIPTIAPLNGGLRKTGYMRPYGGMNTHNGRTRWGNVRVTTSFTPAKYAKGKDTHPLISIVATGSGGLGFDYAELAGIRRRPPRQKSKGWNSTTQGYHSYTVNGQGDAMIEKLNRAVPFRGKAGRFAFAVVLSDRPQLERDSMNILKRYADKANQKLYRVGRR